MKTNQLRKLFLDYFQGLGHRVYGSDSLVPANDPSVLFTGAGMNQFKSHFLGEKKEPKRAASCQKCLRTADLDRVGETATHHTFFEMLGNFSFGDYFKEEAIDYAWNFVTRELGLSKDRLWVSVFAQDDEAFEIWRKKIGIPEKRIVRFSAEDNFWPANAPKDGPNGPCGPCSELYVGETPGKGVEIWNLVFTQFDRQEDGFLKPLPQKNIDTGMGLERLASVLQGVESNFEIDAFTEIDRALVRAAGPEAAKPSHRRAKHAVLDHARAAVFTIGDGVTPSNEGRGYVVRKIIRKAVLHLSELGLKEPGLYELVPAVVSSMKEPYPELGSREKNIAHIIRKEEESFWSVLETRVPQAVIKLKRIALTFTPGKERTVESTVAQLAFEYYDTYGVPKEILKDLVTKEKLPFNSALFEAEVERQRGRSRASSHMTDSIFGSGDRGLFRSIPPPTEFVGYETLKARARIAGLLSDGKEADRLEKGQKGFMVFDRTPFYAEQGGQIGDEGLVRSAQGKASVLDTKWRDEVVLHSVDVTEGSFKRDDTVELEVSDKNRSAVMNNHTATHLLHSALRRVLGAHVKQNGSLVAADRLRFDFTHFQPMTPQELRRVEAIVNAEIEKSTPLRTREMKTKDAITEGAIAFFGEKYKDSVRVVSIADFSTELCGGTHCRNTGEIGLFRIASENSIQSGVRRIEAVTAEAAFKKRDESKRELEDLAAYLGTGEASLVRSIDDGLKITGETQKKIRALLQKKFREDFAKKLEKAPKAGDARIWVERLPEINIDFLRETADWLRSNNSCAIVLSTENQKKPQVIVALSRDIVAQGLSANELIRDIAKRIEGSGGGRPELAVGGGKSLESLDAALRFAGEFLMRSLGPK